MLMASLVVGQQVVAQQDQVEGLRLRGRIEQIVRHGLVLAHSLGVNPELNKRDWNVLFPISVVAQSSDGSIYFTEPGCSSFSVLKPTR